MHPAIVSEVSETPRINGDLGSLNLVTCAVFSHTAFVVIFVVAHI